MSEIGPVYHWSPTSRRREIRQNGLRPFSEPVVSAGGDPEDPDVEAHCWPYLCFGCDPAMAWGYSGDMGYVSEIEEWDLWQVRLEEGDEIHYRAEFGPRIIEVRCATPIPADRCWLVGSREPASAEPIRTTRSGKKVRGFPRAVRLQWPDVMRLPEIAADLLAQARNPQSPDAKKVLREDAKLIQRIHDEASRDV